MAVQTLCPHCNKQQTPFITPKTDVVYCGGCDKEIQVNHFIKVQLKTLKQYREEKKTPFSVKCQSCQKEDKPKIKSGDVICPHCSKPHNHLTPQFKLMLKEKLPNSDKDV